MKKYRDLLNNPLVIGGVAFILGLIIGLTVLGWVLFPVQWTDASPRFLEKSFKEDYVKMVIESFSKNQDKELAKKRWKELGEDAPAILSKIQANPGYISQVDINQFALAVQATGLPPVAQPTTPPKAATQPPKAGTPAATAPSIPTPTKVAATDSGGLRSSLTLILGVMCVLTLLVGGALVYILFFRNRAKGGLAGGRQAAAPVETGKAETQQAPGLEAPVAQFMTTYRLGDDLYDDSFSIDSPTGEFLGECGVGISETIGVGDPKKVSAFEVWLFDKNDIQTVTRVLMSAHAFDDPTIRQRLASKGEPVLAEPGMVVLLETATLQLEARVVDMTYGQGALPVTSFFENMTLELAVWPKPAA
jgi:hypothetical protein